MKDKKIDESLISNSVMLSIENTDKILSQMKNSVCNIVSTDINGTAYFSNLALDNKKNIKVLITALHVFNKICSNIMEIFLNNGKKKYSINLKDSRFIYEDDKNDIVIIEILPKDNINSYDLKIEHNEDKRKKLENFYNLYDKKLVYILEYPNGRGSQVSYGMSRIVFNSNGNNDYSIRHSCSTEFGASGSPIILIETFEVIGIHLYGNEEHTSKYNSGNFIFDSINSFKEKYMKKFKCYTKEETSMNYIYKENMNIEINDIFNNSMETSKQNIFDLNNNQTTSKKIIDQNFPKCDFVFKINNNDINKKLFDFNDKKINNCLNYKVFENIMNDKKKSNKYLNISDELFSYDIINDEQSEEIKINKINNTLAKKSVLNYYNFDNNEDREIKEEFKNEKEISLLPKNMNIKENQNINKKENIKHCFIDLNIENNSNNESLNEKKDLHISKTLQNEKNNNINNNKDLKQSHTYNKKTISPYERKINNNSQKGKCVNDNINDKYSSKRNSFGMIFPDNLKRNLFKNKSPNIFNKKSKVIMKKKKNYSLNKESKSNIKEINKSFYKRNIYEKNK